MNRVRRTVLKSALAATISVAVLAGPAVADDASNVAAAGGVIAYLGLMPAALLADHAPEHPEVQMHGGPPVGQHAYHLVLAVFDEASGLRIEDARASATVSGSGHIGRISLTLDPMVIENTVTYGGFVDMTGYERYEIEATIIVPDRADPVRVTFSGDHLP